MYTNYITLSTNFKNYNINKFNTWDLEFIILTFSSDKLYEYFIKIN